MDTLGHLLHGFSVTLQPHNLLYCFLGVFGGTLVGVLPGLGPQSAIVLLLPAAVYLEPVSAIIMLAGVYYGSMYGGSTTSILVNIPGEGASVVTCIDGHQMALQGRAGPGFGHCRVRLFHCRHVRADAPDSRRRAHRRLRIALRAAGILRADVPGAGDPDQPVRHSLRKGLISALAGSVSRHHRAGSRDGRAALHAGPARAVRRHRSDPRHHGTLWRGRSAHQRRAGRDAHHRAGQDPQSLAEPRGLAPIRRADRARHVARLAARHPARRRRRAGELPVLHARAPRSPRTRNASVMAPSKASRGPSPPTTPPRSAGSSHCCRLAYPPT